MGRYKHYIKKRVTPYEFSFHTFIYNLGIVNTPKIIRYNSKKQKLTLEHVGNDNISNVYGDSPQDIPEYLFDKIREIILILYQNGITYPDITGYNFIEHKNNGKVYIIDFEHASYLDENTNDFIEEFLDGHNEWNPEFS